MRTFRFAAIGLLVVAAGVFGWRATRTGLQREIASRSPQPFVTQPAIPPLQLRARFGK